MGACNTTDLSAYLMMPTGIAFNGNYVYITNSASDSYTQCVVNNFDGALVNCSTKNPSFSAALTSPQAIVFH